MNTPMSRIPFLNPYSKYLELGSFLLKRLQVHVHILCTFYSVHIPQPRCASLDPGAEGEQLLAEVGQSLGITFRVCTGAPLTPRLVQNRVNRRNSKGTCWPRLWCLVLVVPSDLEVEQNSTNILIECVLCLVRDVSLLMHMYISFHVFLCPNLHKC